MRNPTVTILFALVAVAACGGGGGGNTAPYNAGNPSGTGTTTSSDGGAAPPNGVVARAGRYFDPASLTVSLNTTVSFVFESTGHNVTFDPVAGHPDDIAGTNSNTTITRVFSSSGTFTYHCTIHSGMEGTVVVH